MKWGSLARAVWLMDALGNLKVFLVTDSNQQMGKLETTFLMHKLHLLPKHTPL